MSFVHGRCRQVVKAPVCGIGIRGFESHHLPHLEKTNRRQTASICFLRVCLCGIDPRIRSMSGCEVVEDWKVKAFIPLPSLDIKKLQSNLDA
jgi:hypothetical protein